MILNEDAVLVIRFSFGFFLLFIVNGLTFLHSSYSDLLDLTVPKFSLEDICRNQQNDGYYKCCKRKKKKCRKGSKGATGATGSTGPMGSTGSKGLTGVTGAMGPTGPNGEIGARGATGATGLSGEMGSTGETGMMGLIGPTGSVGATGQQGATGSTGVTGMTGTSTLGSYFFAYSTNEQIYKNVANPYEISIAFDEYGPISSDWLLANPGGNHTSFVVPQSGTYMMIYQSAIGIVGFDLLCGIGISINGIAAVGTDSYKEVSQKQNTTQSLKAEEFIQGNCILNLTQNDVISVYLVGYVPSDYTSLDMGIPVSENYNGSSNASLSIVRIAVD